MRNSTNTAEWLRVYTIHRQRSLLAGLLLGLCTASAASEAPFDATPADNEAIAVAQGALGSAHIGSVVGGIIAPGFLGTGFELAALGTDISLKNTPPVLTLPANRALFPNAVATGDLSGRQCVYRFGSTIRPDDYVGGVEEGFASIYFVPFDPLDRVFADLGVPDVYHAQADVRVRASNRYLGARANPELGVNAAALLQRRPEFPAGRHVIDWEARSSLNYIMDIGVPGALIPVGLGAEAYLAKKVASTSRRAFIDNSVGIASELGLIAADVSSLPAKTQWYADTQLFTASNRSTQTFTVWDTSLPFLRDTTTQENPLVDQLIELEATDFGGVRFGRVENDLRARFEAVDPCGRQFTVSTSSPFATLFTIGTPNELVWEIREIDGGPYRPDVALGSNQEIDGEGVVTYLTQRISVVDSQAPILVPPTGFARYEEDGIDLTSGSFPLGRPRVVDLADPSPTVTNDAPAFLLGPGAGADGVRYDITWDAIDDSQNSALANSSDPAGFVQTVTLKRPGTNTVPTALPASADAVTANAVDIRLEGIDTDLIDGRVDPLEFEIESYPANGQLDAPLYPYFIEDFRLTPVGEREEGDNLTRVSPLQHLADTFRLQNPNNHGTFLTNQICNAAPGSLNDATFGGVIPVNMVYEPSYVHVSDDGYHYIYDKYYICGETPKTGQVEQRPTLSPLPRLSKWTESGELIAMTPLYPTDAPGNDEGHLDTNEWPQGRFSVDHDNRIWVEWKSVFTFFSDFSSHYSFDENLGDVQYHGTVSYNEQQAIEGNKLRDVGSDGNTDLLFELKFTSITIRELDGIIDIGNDSEQVGELDVSEIEMSDLYSFFNPSGLRHGIGEDISVDRDGNVYVLDRERNRVHKWSRTTQNESGGWQPGEYVGWMGSCTGNRTIDGTPTGVPFNACDVAVGTSRGYACSDSRCTRAATAAATAGSATGQFNAPGSIEIDPRNILYVADTGNLRVQRFGPDGTFAGQAESTGSGVNQGDDPGFILGNMGSPKYLSVNSSSFFVMEPDAPNGDNFVHVFKTLPFRDVTSSGASVRYVSNTTFQGDDSFAYTVYDGIDESAPALVSVSVSRAFRAPENLRAQCFATSALETAVHCELSEDGEIFVRLSASDPDGFISDAPLGLDALTFELLDEPAHGRLTLPGPEFEQDNAITYRYTPDPDFNGEDALRFRAYDGDQYSADDAILKLAVTPVPDPVTIEFDDDLRAARGFPAVVSARFSDVDQHPDQQASLVSLNWGDGVTVTPGDWSGSGRMDLNGREISPQLDFGRGSGMLLGSHNYTATGMRTMTAVMEHAAAENLPPAEQQAVIEVVDVTVVAAGLASPSTGVAPDATFPLVITVTNLEPSSWSGLTADDVAISFDVPEGLQVTLDDVRCSGSATIHCDLGDLASGASTDVTLGGLIGLPAARSQASYPLTVTLSDAGPKLTATTLASLSVAIADRDGDGRIDVDDAFADDARYQADTDGDGLPDSWELARGFDPAAPDDVSVDADGDGFTLLEEFEQGSFPFLEESEVTLAGNRLEPAGGADFDLFGGALAGGDLNRDGYADLVIGASEFTTGESDTAGAAFIAWGGANGANPVLQVLRPQSDALTGLGQTVAVGDWDGNGYPDLAIGAQESVAIHWNNGQILDRPDLLLPMSNTGGPDALELVSGDIDNDGIDDLVATVYEGPSINSRLEIYTSTGGGLTATPLRQYTSQRFDHASPVLIDVDGDGATDLFFGAPEIGFVYGYFGADNDWQSLPLVTGTLMAAPAGQQEFGWSLAGGGDVTGDGIADLVIGARGDGGFVNLYDSSSRYWAIGGTAPLQILRGLAGSEPGNDENGDRLGSSLAMAHLDRDGYADLVVGASRDGGDDQGGLLILRGSPAGFVDARTDIGTTNYDLLGTRVVIPGDVDGDGVADIAGGAPNPALPENPPPDGGYVQLYYHAYMAVNANDDPDGDGVAAAFDNCPAAPNTNQADMDNDGDGDACDADIDGDGLTNAADNCPLIDSLDQTDTDGDLDGDLCDDDDDNDNVADTEDAFPLNADYQADSDSDGLPDSYETLAGLDPADASDALADLDGDGRSNLDEFTTGSDIAADDVAPVVLAPAAVTVDAIGPLTPVPLNPGATATDAKDGAIEAAADRQGPFWPGPNVVTYTAVDAAGNAGSATQDINVVPLLGFVGDTLYAAEGSVAEVRVALNGDAITYPVTVTASLSGDATAGSDFVLDSSTVTIDNSNSAVFSLQVLADGVSEGEETLILTLDAPGNAVAGPASTFTVRVADGNRAPVLQMAIEQGGRHVTTVTRDGPPVTLSAVWSDPNPLDEHTTSWNISDNSIRSQDDFRQSTFTFDPEAVAEGTYTLLLGITDNGSPVARAGRGRYLRVTATEPAWQPGLDSDGDGIADADEGLRDSNGNGASDYLDASYFSYHVPARSGGSGLLQAADGYQLSLGRIALATGDDAMVSLGDIAAYGDDGTPVDNADDARNIFAGGIFNVELSGLPKFAHVVAVVIPQMNPVPAAARMRMYGSETGWRDFVENSVNSLSSAPGEAGACPLPGSTLYLPGLTAGHHCVQLRMQDNGPNDNVLLASDTVAIVAGVSSPGVASTIDVRAGDVADRTVRAGDAGVVILRFRLNSNSSDVILNGLTFKASGSGDDAADIANVRLWIDSNGDGLLDAGDTEAGSGTFGSDNDELSLQLASPVTLDAGTTDFHVTYDF